MIACVMAAGCGQSAENDAVSVCEGKILKSLRSPSTYNQIQTSVSPPEFEPKVWVVAISYDAANAYGTPVRGGYLCAFKADAEGNLPEKTDMELAALTSELDVQNALSAGDQPDADTLDVFPCCLTKDDKARFTALWPTGEPRKKQSKN